MARFDKIMDQGGWKSELTVERYIRDGNLFTENAASKLDFKAQSNDLEICTFHTSRFFLKLLKDFQSFIIVLTYDYP